MATSVRRSRARWTLRGTGWTGTEQCIHDRLQDGSFQGSLYFRALTDDLAVPSTPVAIAAFTAVSALGTGCAAHVAALRTGRSGLRRNDYAPNGPPLPCWIGRVDDRSLRPAPGLDTRLHRLLILALAQDDFGTLLTRALSDCGATRVSLVLGTSTANIETSEQAYRRLDHGHLPRDLADARVYHLHGPAEWLCAHTGIAGPAFTVSTACSASAKAFGLGARLLHAGIADAVLVAGADSLCSSTLYGFNALQLVDAAPCRPFDVERAGLSIGEGAALALLRRVADAPGAPRLLACGESSDAHHLSAPHPEGLGATRALQAALHECALPAHAFDYINLHGTASRQNDAVEAALVAQALPGISASSTKGATGHTLGAAGALEAVLTLLALHEGVVPATVGCIRPEPGIAAQLALVPQSRALHRALSFSFGFGGSNACLAFAGADAA